MFKSFMIPMLSASERLAPRFFENHSKVNAAIESSSRDMSMVFMLMVIAIAAVGITVAINAVKNSRKDEQIAIKEIALAERTARAEERIAKQNEELANARHMIAILRAGTYVPLDDVSPETPTPDSVFGAKPVASKPSDVASPEPEEAEPVPGSSGNTNQNPSQAATEGEGVDSDENQEVSDADIERIMAEDFENERNSRRE